MLSSFKFSKLKNMPNFQLKIINSVNFFCLNIVVIIILIKIDDKKQD